MLNSFDYIVDEQTTTLIIGSMPSICSLEAREYYAHKQNNFWKFVFSAFNVTFNEPCYQEKITLLKNHHFGLWDSVKSCIREGSLDINIKNVIPNDFETLLNTYPHIDHLLFNGKKSFQLFRRFHCELLDRYSYEILPSTSSANASIPLEQRKEIWRKALLR